jgi:hypothetical protein
VSGTTELTAFQQSPIAASQVFGSAGVPRQHHTYIVRFQPNNQSMQTTEAAALTFAVKRCDRPKVQIKTEELNQYNKKRQVYTGFKLDPVRISFYDTADGAAQNMWQTYAQYYFGDFISGAQTGYHQYDITTGQYNSARLVSACHSHTDRMPAIQMRNGFSIRFRFCIITLRTVIIWSILTYCIIRASQTTNRMSWIMTPERYR